MKTKFLIIIGIAIASVISLAYYAIYDSSTTVFLSCDPKHEQIGDKCILLKPKQYCTDWCDVEELSTLGCDRLALDYIFRATNIIDGKPGEPHYWNWIGMPDGLSEEEFEMCSDILKEKRSAEYENNSGISIDRTVFPDPQFCADEYDKLYLKAAAIPCDCCNPPPGEPVCEPPFLEDYIRDMITEEFKPCISTIDRWAYLTENNDSVWYAFGTNYVKLKMEKTNHEESIPISITFSGYSQCLNNFHLIVKEHIGDRKVVFEEKYNQVCDDSKPNNEFKTYREINLDGIGTPIILPKGQYLVELYTDTPQKHGSNYVNKVFFSSHFETGPVIKLDAINQSNPSVWIVTGKTTDTKSEIIMHLYNPENVFISRDIVLPDSDGNFSTVITNGGSLFKLSGHYKITLQQGDVPVPQVSRLFSVVQNEN